MDIIEVANGEEEKALGWYHYIDPVGFVLQCQMYRKREIYPLASGD